MTGSGVPRVMAAFPDGRESHPVTAPVGRDRIGHLEVAEASYMDTAHKLNV